MEATAGAAPSSGAGTGSAQGASTSSSNSSGNSSAQPSTTQRQSGAAPPSSTPTSTIDNRDAREARQASGRDESGRFTTHQGAGQDEQPAGDEDPEFDFGDGRKAKRSRVVNDFKTLTGRLQAEAKRANEVAKQLETERGFRQHLQSLGVDPEAFSKNPQEAFQQAVLNNVRRQIEEAQMDPRELELKRREETLAEREKRIETETKQKQEHEHTARVEARANEFAAEMYEALDASDLPRDPQVVARMASLMLAARRSGSQISKAELAARVAHQIAAEQEYYDSKVGGVEQASTRMQKLLPHFKGDGAALAKALGPENTEALRKHLLSEVQSKFHPNKPSTPPRHAASKVLENPKQPNGYISWDEMQTLARQRRL